MYHYTRHIRQGRRGSEPTCMIIRIRAFNMFMNHVKRNRKLIYFWRNDLSLCSLDNPKQRLYEGLVWLAITTSKLKYGLVLFQKPEKLLQSDFYDDMFEGSADDDYRPNCKPRMNDDDTIKFDGLDPCQVHVQIMEILHASGRKAKEGLINHFYWNLTVPNSFDIFGNHFFVEAWSDFVQAKHRRI